MIQISKDYKPYIQHVILSVPGLLAMATVATALIFVGYLAYYSIAELTKPVELRFPTSKMLSGIGRGASDSFR